MRRSSHLNLPVSQSVSLLSPLLCVHTPLTLTLITQLLASIHNPLLFFFFFFFSSLGKETQADH